MRAHSRVAIYFIALFAVSCGQSSGTKEKDTPTSGNICIASDDELMSLTKAEVNVYRMLYHNAVIRPVYKPEDSAFLMLRSDSVRLIVASRKLSPSEETYFKDRQFVPEQVKIATDAITFIVNNNNPDILLSVEQIKAIFAGTINNWQQLGGKQQDAISVVFDHEGSGNSRYIQQNLLNGSKFPSYCFALHNSDEVINYVSKNVNALGVIGLNRISNVYDSTVTKALANIKVVAISAKESANAADFYQPGLESLENGQYPLCRDIYIISCEPYTGLGSGFLAFVTSNKGERIIYREGLLPARMPSHDLHF